MRYFLELSYDGTRYAGWQRQPIVTTVQGCIEVALSTILKKETPIYGCGRTDKGVHAQKYIAHVDISADCPLSIEDIVYKLNRILDRDIALHRMIKVNEEAHARYDAIARTYIYSLHMKKSPFMGVFSTLIRDGHHLDFSLLQEVAAIIQCQSDFTSFCKLHGSETGNDCKVTKSLWTLDDSGQKMTYEITANRFLRGMVRLIVGSSLNVATGKLSIAELVKHITAGTRSPLMKSAPPQGLSLVKIEYPYI